MQVSRIETAPIPAEPVAPRVRRLPAPPTLVVETLAWAGFAVVVALVVIAAAGRDVGRVALWATGLGAIVVVTAVVTVLHRAGQNLPAEPGSGSAAE